MFPGQSLFRCLLILPEFVGLGLEQLSKVTWLGPSPTSLDIVVIPQEHVDEGSGEACNMISFRIRRQIANGVPAFDVIR